MIAGARQWPKELRAARKLDLGDQYALRNIPGLHRMTLMHNKSLNPHAIKRAG